MADMQKAVTLGHPIKHSLGLLGMIAGIIVGALLVIAIAVAIGVTGGAALLVVAGSACLLGAIFGKIGMTLGSGMGITTGMIGMPCSPNVFSESKNAAHTTSLVVCKGKVPFFPHPGSFIAEGSATVIINGQYAARVEHKTTCGAIAGGGCKSVIIGGPTIQIAPIEPEIPSWANPFLWYLAGAGLVLITFGLAGPLAAVEVFAGYAAEFIADYVCQSDTCRTIFGAISVVLMVVGIAQLLIALAKLGPAIGRRVVNLFRRGTDEVAEGISGGAKASDELVEGANDAVATARAKENLRKTLKNDADELSHLPKAERGPVVARAYDPKTGRTTQRYTNVDELPEDLDPILMDRVNELNNNGAPHYSAPGTHAEVLAVDDILKSRRAAGEEVTAETLNEIIHDQYWLDVKPNRPNGGINPAPTCENCTHILRGAESMGGNK